MNCLSKNIFEIHQAIVDGKVTPLELVQESLRLAKKDKNNAFEYICEKEAIEKAKNLNIDKKNNLLFGIPIVIKDNFSTKDIPTTGSSNILNGYVPVFSSEVVLRLENEGAIIIGKTTLDELGMGGTGMSGHKGATFNPWDKSHTHQVGGSSCGSAAAISAGIVPLAIGSDTGDSVRKPASYVGIVGFKPTYGRISRYGLFPFATSLDHIAYFTRNVKDCALTLNILAGRDNKDFSSSFEKVDDYLMGIDRPISGMKIAVIKEIIECMPNKHILKMFNKTITALKQQGVSVEIVNIDIRLLKAIYPTYIIISSAESTSNNAGLDGIKYGDRKQGNTYEEVVMNSRSAGFSEFTKRRFVIGSFSLLKENRDELFTRAQKCRRLIVDEFNKIFEKYDAIYCPAAPDVAPLLKGASITNSDNLLISDNYLAFANMGGFPSITLPLGFDNGLPFGVNISSKPFTESKLLNIANKVEEITGLKDLIAGDK